MSFSNDELKKRAYKRVADALLSFWEEQKDDQPRAARVHSRIFEALVYNKYIVLNQKTEVLNYPEHVVPCAYIRDYAFKMFWNGKMVEDVATMIGRLLHIAYITRDDQAKVDAINKSTMPDDWNPETDSILRRLEDASVKVVGMNLF